MVTIDRNPWAASMAAWQTPDDLMDKVASCSEEEGGFGVMIHAGLGFWRDGWIAAKFAKSVNADLVRLLHPAPFPDFAVRYGSDERWFEATEADEVGRRRGDEYRNHRISEDAGQSTAQPHPEEDWLTPDRAHAQLRTASHNKASKEYATDCGLVILLNGTDYGTREQEISGVMVDATSEAGRAFQSVDVLWGAKHCRTWFSGEAQELV